MLRRLKQDRGRRGAVRPSPPDQLVGPRGGLDLGLGPLGRAASRSRRHPRPGRPRGTGADDRGLDLSGMLSPRYRTSAGDRRWGDRGRGARGEAFRGRLPRLSAGSVRAAPVGLRARLDRDRAGGERLGRPGDRSRCGLPLTGGVRSLRRLPTTLCTSPSPSSTSVSAARCSPRRSPGRGSWRSPSRRGNRGR